MINFDFVSGDEFRVALQSDYAELERAVESGSWKSALVLAGSIVEAVLVDYLSGGDLLAKKGIDPLSLDLGAAIKLCREEGILSERAANLSDVIRSYRNLIHPGRGIRLGETADESSARVALTLVDMVAKEVDKTRAEKKGLTAEQLASKLSRDSSSVVILPHLVADLDKGEPERFLTKVLPEAYLEALNPVAGDGALAERLRRAYRQVFDAASDAVKKRAAARFVVILKEEYQGTVEAWEAALFRPEMLRHLSKPEADMVKTHLLARLKGERTIELFSVAKGISPFLSANELPLVVDAVVQEIIYGTSVEVDKAARELLHDVWARESNEQDVVLLNRLKTWVDFLKSKDRGDEAATIDALRAEFLIEDLPF